MTRFRISLEYVIANCTVVCLASHAAVGADASVGLVAEDNNTWELWAWTSTGDNDGTMAYDVEIDGTYVSGRRESPLGTFGGTPLSGFVVGGEAIPNDNTDNRLSARMRDDDSLPVIYGVGSPDAGNRTLEKAVGQNDLPQERHHAN